MNKYAKFSSKLLFCLVRNITFNIISYFTFLRHVTFLSLLPIIWILICLHSLITLRVNVFRQEIWRWLSYNIQKKAYMVNDWLSVKYCRPKSAKGKREGLFFTTGISIFSIMLQTIELTFTLKKEGNYPQIVAKYKIYQTRNMIFIFSITEFD